MSSWTNRLRASGHGHRLHSLTDRALDVIDIAHEMMGREQNSGEVVGFVDVSQCVTRENWGITLPSMNASSLWWSFERKRLLVADEHLRVLGYDLPGASPTARLGGSAVRNLTGEAMAPPCVGAILGALVSCMPTLF